MSPVSIRCLIASALACAMLIAPIAALAQQAPSTLLPFAPQMTGRPASELPIDKLTVPAGFKVEVWADGIPEARSLALGDKGTVFGSNRLAKNVYALVDRGGKGEGKTILKGP